VRKKAQNGAACEGKKSEEIRDCAIIIGEGEAKVKLKGWLRGVRS